MQQIQRKMKQPEVILRFLAYIGTWVEGYNLEKIVTPFGWISHQGMRTCRTLAENGYLETRYIARYVCYRITEQGLKRLDALDGEAVVALRAMRKAIPESSEQSLFDGVKFLYLCSSLPVGRSINRNDMEKIASYSVTMLEHDKKTTSIQLEMNGTESDVILAFLTGTQQTCRELLRGHNLSCNSKDCRVRYLLGVIAKTFDAVEDLRLLE
ncbi:unnamed protein product [Sphagnum balticum]